MSNRKDNQGDLKGEIDAWELSLLTKHGLTPIQHKTGKDMMTTEVVNNRPNAIESAITTINSDIKASQVQIQARFA
jgi:hypothetical protein